MDIHSTFNHLKSACGGCALYVNSQLDHHVRNDLSALEEEYETLYGLKSIITKLRTSYAVVCTDILQVTSLALLIT